MATSSIGGRCENAQHQPILEVATFNPARIWTDKDDYAPDDPVILSGSGWKASEGVQLYAVDNATEQWTYGSTVPANANGEFVVSPFLIVELRHLGVQFHVTALGAQSAMQADVKFTDAGVMDVTVLGAQTPSPVTAGNTATYGNGTATNSVRVRFNGNTNNCTVNLSASGLPAGATANFNPSSLSSTGADQFSLLTVSTTGATAGGTYTFTITGTRSGCQGGGAGLRPPPRWLSPVLRQRPRLSVPAPTRRSMVIPSLYGDGNKNKPKWHAHRQRELHHRWHRHGHRHGGGHYREYCNMDLHNISTDRRESHGLGQLCPYRRIPGQQRLVVWWPDGQ